jgi:hypothetical protein
MSDDFERDPLARQLRESLARHAAEAPRGDLLAERIVHAADQQSAAARGGRGRRWRTWALPAVAAAAVGGVVLAVMSIENYHPTPSAPPASSPQPSVLRSSQPAPSSTAPTPSTTGPAPSNVPALTGVRILDLTFVGEDTGWALASADCLTGAGRCTALLRTTDGLRWDSMGAGIAFNVPGVSAGCATKCVTNIRFANTDVGYAFGPNAFFMTTDGGSSWQQRPGGALQVETLNQNVIRVTANPASGCPGPCNVRIETAPIGSPTWTPARMPDAGLGLAGVQLSRGGHDAYLLLTRNPAGGAGSATSTLLASTDNGATWRSLGEPCPQAGQEVDSTAVAAGGGDRVSVLCMTRQAPNRYTVATSSDAGLRFTPRPGRVPAAIAPGLLTGDPDTVLVAAGSGLARSVDGGRSWRTVPDVTGRVTFVGFESGRVGRAVTDDGVIWTTHDAGKTWTAVRFG